MSSSLAWARSDHRAKRTVLPKYAPTYNYIPEVAPALVPVVAALLDNRLPAERKYVDQAARRAEYLRNTNRSAGQESELVQAMRNDRFAEFVLHLGRRCFICGRDGLCAHRERAALRAERSWEEYTAERLRREENA